MGCSTRPWHNALHYQSNSASLTTTVGHSRSSRTSRPRLTPIAPRTPRVNNDWFV